MNDWVLIIMLWQQPHRMAASMIHIPNEQACISLGKKITKHNNIIRNPNSRFNKSVVRKAEYQCYENE